jgi:hypothetical protein
LRLRSRALFLWIIGQRRAVPIDKRSVGVSEIGKYLVDRREIDGRPVDRPTLRRVSEWGTVPRAHE